MYLDIL